MIKRTLTLVFICLIGSQCFSQMLADEKMTFYGLDFSKAKMMGEGFSNPDEVKNRFFQNWNGFFRSENEDYDLGAALKKKVTLDFDNVEKNNKEVDASKLVTNNDYAITAGDAQAVVKAYDTKGRSGLGCSFVVESFDKGKVLATVYVVFFDQATKNIILCKKMEGQPNGFGLKNYWANAIRLIINDCKKQYHRWLKGK